MSTFVLRTNCYRSYKRLYSLLALVPEVKERFKSLPQAIFIPVARLRLIYELFIYLFTVDIVSCIVSKINLLCALFVSLNSRANL